MTYHFQFRLAVTVYDLFCEESGGQGTDGTEGNLGHTGLFKVQVIKNRILGMETVHKR